MYVDNYVYADTCATCVWRAECNLDYGPQKPSTLFFSLETGSLIGLEYSKKVSLAATMPQRSVYLHLISTEFTSMQHHTILFLFTWVLKVKLRSLLFLWHQLQI